MSDEYVISEIRDYMLQERRFSSEFVWTIADIATKDVEMFNLMKEWMKFIYSPSKQELVEEDIDDLYRVYMRAYDN